MTNNLEKQSTNNIYYLFQIRNIFRNYFNFMKDYYKQEHAFHINAKETEEKAVILNRIIRKILRNQKTLQMMK